MAIATAVLLACFVQGYLTATVDVPIREQLVLPGQNATFKCMVTTPLQYCRAEIPGLSVINLSPKQRDPRVTYVGNGLGSGECGFTINRVVEENNGDVKCTIGIEEESMESVGTMKLIVAKQPRQPELELSRGADNIYRINDELRASCIVKDGRPVANISWYLDDNQIPGNELSMPTVYDMAKENLQTQLQNLTRILRASDNGKMLRCVAHHPAYPDGTSEAMRQLDVRYPPQPQDNPIDLFGFKLGQMGQIQVEVEANPKPQVEWTLDGQKIKEGQEDNTGRIQSQYVQSAGRGKYTVSLSIANINKQDTEKEYILTAYNDMGSQEYRVKISTSPEPEGLELGLGSIIGIVVAVCVVVLLVVILIFARMTGRWCFSGKRERHIGESDTESADVQRTKETKRRIPPIKLSSFLKKNKDKVATEEAPETRQIETEAPKAEDETAKEGLVYAELDLVSPTSNPVVKGDEDKTEYAEIVYTPTTETDKNKS
ncbi:fasciclin-3 isoform X2 [Aethina tumida]|uniref:fasciclin-3 isoform X2 n=1 Tax=Aethina tumida TaxID=116153 RepID=UPI0021474A2E|nr:fasciclin-3 isoform X2 [Aethina tumida]